jgi:hypothetical protein
MSAYESYGGRMFTTDFLDDFLEPGVAPTAEQFRDLKAAYAALSDVSLFNKVMEIFDKFSGGHNLSRKPELYAFLVSLQEDEIAKDLAAIQDLALKAKVVARLAQVELWRPNNGRNGGSR